MDEHWHDNPPGHLLLLGDVLGIAKETWPAREELERLTYTDPNLSRDAAISLTLEQLTSLAQTYGDALTCRFLLGNKVVLRVTRQLTEADLEQFRSETKHSPTVVFDLELDKTRLIQNWAGAVPHSRVFLYLFPEALEQFLTSKLGHLESHLWGEETGQKVIFLVPGREIWLDGSYLAVAGGQAVEDEGWRQVVPEQAPDVKRVMDMYQTCRSSLKWQESWLQHLTPLHFDVHGQASPGDAVANALRVHAVNLIVLYTADHTMLRTDRHWLATYAGASQSVEIILGVPEEYLGDAIPQNINSLMDLVSWAYDAHWSTDRLPLAQVAIVQALRAADPALRYRLLLSNAKCIFEGLQWHWKAFVEGKVHAYTAQVRALEDYVASRTQAFADRVSAMIKSLSDTMLATVAALVGSFVAALFKDDFDQTIFTIGMLAYSVFVIILPIGYTMPNHWGWYQSLTKEFNVRRKRFAERIYHEKVDEIVGDQFTDSRRRFEHWFIAICLAYAVVLILVAFVIWHAPQIADAFGPPQSPVPTPTVTP